MSNRVFHQNLWGGLAQSALFVDMFVYQLLLAFLLDSRSYGEVTIVLASAYLFAAILNVGPNNVIINTLSKAATSREELLEVREETTKALIAKMAFGSLLLLPGLLAVRPLAVFYSISEGLMWCASVLVPLVWWHTAGVAVANASDHNRFALGSQLLYAIFHNGLPLLLAATGHLTSQSVLWAAIAARIVAALSFSWVLRKIFVIQSWKGILHTSMLRRFFSFGMPAWSDSFLTLGTVLIVGRVVSVEAAGFVRLATAIVRGVTVAIPISPSLVLSTVRRFFSANHVERLSNYLLVLVGLAVVAGGVAVIALLTVGRLVFGKIYGDRYDAVFPLVAVMCWAVLPLLLKNIVDPTNLVFLSQRAVVILHASFIVVGFSLTAFASRMAGVDGAAYAYVGLAWLLILISGWFLRHPLRAALASGSHKLGAEGSGSFGIQRS